MVLKDGKMTDVKKICAYLKENGIEARSFWKPIHLQKPYASAVKANDLSVTDSLWDRIVTLPCSTNITNEELKYVSEVVRGYYHG